MNMKSLLEQISSREKAKDRYFSCTAHQELAKLVPQVRMFLRKPQLHAANSTLECVAELTQRPLLSFTSGDLGTKTAELDQKLSIFFRLGELWNAIVVIDEADIYFEERAPNDIARNSLVSGT